MSKSTSARRSGFIKTISQTTPAKLGLEILREMAFVEFKKKYRNIPKCYSPVFKFTDRTFTGLRWSIIRFLQLSGHEARKVRSQRSESGMPVDISAIIHGKSVNISIMVNAKEHPQPDQPENTETGENTVCTVRSFEEFYLLFKTRLS